MDRLEAVAHIRQRAMHDGGERVGEIALARAPRAARSPRRCRSAGESVACPCGMVSARDRGGQAINGPVPRPNRSAVRNHTQPAAARPMGPLVQPRCRGPPAGRRRAAQGHDAAGNNRSGAGRRPISAADGGCSSGTPQEIGQRQQLVVIRRGRPRARRRGRSGRDIGELGSRAGGGAARQIEAETELRQQPQLPSTYARGQPAGIDRVPSAQTRTRQRPPACGSRSGKVAATKPRPRRARPARPGRRESARRASSSRLAPIVPRCSGSRPRQVTPQAIARLQHRPRLGDCPPRTSPR